MQNIRLQFGDKNPYFIFKYKDTYNNITYNTSKILRIVEIEDILETNIEEIKKIKRKKIIITGFIKQENHNDFIFNLKKVKEFNTLYCSYVDTTVSSATITNITTTKEDNSNLLKLDISIEFNAFIEVEETIIKELSGTNRYTEFIYNNNSLFNAEYIIKCYTGTEIFLEDCMVARLPNSITLTTGQLFNSSKSVKITDFDRFALLKYGNDQGSSYTTVCNSPIESTSLTTITCSNLEQLYPGTNRLICWAKLKDEEDTPIFFEITIKKKVLVW